MAMKDNTRDIVCWAARANRYTFPAVRTISPLHVWTGLVKSVEKVTGRGFLVPDAHGSTSRPGVFASGDVVLGTRTVVEAVKYSKEVARAMDEYLRSIG